MQSLPEKDSSFIYLIEQYQYAVFHPEHREQHALKDEMREEGLKYLQRIEGVLANQNYLNGIKPGKKDVFWFNQVKRFVRIEHGWFATAPYIKTQNWVERMDAGYLSIWSKIIQRG
ncbi:MAG: glutathione binding-like protein [bacterium]|nr:glutathione binding-like protein [bacterium]